MWRLLSVNGNESTNRSAIWKSSNGTKPATCQRCPPKPRNTEEEDKCVLLLQRDKEIVRYMPAAPVHRPNDLLRTFAGRLGSTTCHKTANRISSTSDFLHAGSVTRPTDALRILLMEQLKAIVPCRYLFFLHFQIKLYLILCAYSENELPLKKLHTK